MIFKKKVLFGLKDGNPVLFVDNGADTAYSQYMAHQTIHSYEVAGDDESLTQVEIFIPYSSIADTSIEPKNSNTKIKDDNCPNDENTCEGIYLFYWKGRDPVALMDGDHVVVEPDTLFFFCSDAPEGEPIPVTATSSDPAAFSVEIVSDDVVGFNLIKGTGANTNITVTVPSHNCSISFTASDSDGR